MKILNKQLIQSLKILLTSAIYFGLAILSLNFSFQSSNATPIWPPSGLAFAILLLWGRRLAPGIFIGAFAANLFVFLNHHITATVNAIAMSAFISIGNTAEALIGYFLLQKFCPGIAVDEILNKANSVLSFAFTALLMCLVSCTIGSTATLIGSIIPSTEYFHVWFTWWAGDVSGVLLVTPLLIVLFSARWQINKKINLVKTLEAIFIIAIVTITSGTVFKNLFDPSFLFTRAFIIIPFLIWAAIRLNQKLITAVLILSAIIAVTGTLRGIGPFVGPSLNDSLLTAQLFVSTNSVMVWLLQAAILERKQKEYALNTAKESLEELVNERTKALNEKNEQLQKRNSELGLFSYAVSHDLQEPLRKIDFFTARIMEKDQGLSEEGKGHFNRIRSSVSRMSRLIENLLSYSKVEGNKKPAENVDLNGILQDVKNDLAEMMEQTGAVMESTELPKIKAVTFQMQQLFTNIISNSIKFRKKDVRPHIIIDCVTVVGSALDCPEADHQKSYYHISIKDNGIGFDQEYASTVFDMLQKLHGQNEYEGTGIGLAICKKVVENHKGFIQASVQTGEGCTMHIFLPMDNMIRQPQTLSL
jgi:signal transduction histidine kinase